MALRCRSRKLDQLLEAWHGDESGLVFVADDATTDDWSEVAGELTEAFRLTQQAVTNGVAVVFVVHNDDLLGRNGPGRAMVATGLLSGARTAALEHRKAGTPINVIALEDGSDPELVARWCRLLIENGDLSGQLIHLGSEHLGKALP